MTSQPRQSKMDDALIVAGDALSALTCPYYVSEGTCESGCYSEPRCITDTPAEGWERSLLRAASVVDALARRPNSSSTGVHGDPPGRSSDDCPGGEPAA